ncbi:DNA repair exonuclease SbcCD ATPase subunit [Streptomyces griseochromogenes]|uniref:DNA repair exonuclease SbcCD ATPase subunit n=1 Tax=Streptomyces griseochromogenes TaxID=68214 RepID=A0A1B1B8Z8_9ACTN|nr:hypothetical protein [Streptomyces griseochromogenes]ANP55314.1 hypothetical protein AVL59_42075 [Streptomyces griseochromogenes]MBP2054465.1 DNA repair exonuclease SbcCD ATPase subunit [Streptomyces griseochromogenes]
MADHLKCSETSLSRFLSGQSVPRSVDFIYKKACADAGGGDVLGISFDELEKLREQAWAERCHSCVALRAERDALVEQVADAQAELTGLRKAAARDAAELAALRQDAQSFVAVQAERDALIEQVKDAQAELTGLRKTAARDAAELAALRQQVRSFNEALLELRESVTELRATRAGLQARLAAQASLTLLPVPRRRGDRQQSGIDASAARRVAQQAAELHDDGRQGAALSLLRHTTDVLSPLETATLLQALRRQQQNKLADNVIHIYGRDHHDQDVLQVTLELHKLGAPDDAGALLRAALG